MANTRVPFVDLYAQYVAHADEFDAAFRAVIEQTAFIGGKFVAEFESAFTAACGTRHCIPVANGTDAIYIVLKMLGIGPGDEVITTASSWISTAETIGQTGAKPVFVDVDDFYNLDADKMEAAFTPRTKAVIPVHLYGQAARVDRIAEIAGAHHTHLIEDCAQAHFAARNGRLVGTFGIAGTFSFYPGKNLGAYGDAGAIVTNDDSLARLCRMYANHGALVKHVHEMEGINSRLDGLQAALLSCKLKYISDWTEARQRVAEWYAAGLSNLKGVELPRIRQNSTHVFHLYVIRCSRRDELKAWLADAGIETAIHYPTPLPLLPAYRRLGLTAGDFPNASRNHREILSLPIYPEMTNELVQYVVERIRYFYLRG